MEERRESLRIDERIPLTVSNRSAGWTEETETENLSTNGCLFSLRKEVEVGDQLELSTKAGPSASID